MDRWPVVMAVVAAGCTPAAPPPAQPAPPSAPLDAGIDARPVVAVVHDAASIDACADQRMASSREDYPVPSATEPTSSWFFDGRGWRHIVAACDLRDRVVMLDDNTAGPSGGVMWIWTRRDGSARQFPVDETQGHAGHSTSTAKTAPPEDRVVDFIRDATMFHGRVGRTYSTMVDCRVGDDQAVEYLVACSTRQHFAEIDARLPPACATFPDGVGWPLSLTVADATDARTITPGSLATISADRTTWTYHFESGDELELRVGPTHGGELRIANHKPEPCVMIFSDHRRTPAP